MSVTYFWAQRYHGQKIIGYIPSYNSSDNVAYEKLTHAVWSFLKNDSEGNILEMENWQKKYFDYYKSQTDLNGVKRVISIGGATADLTALTSNISTISKFTDTLIAYCKANNFEVVDLDWEGFQGEQASNQYKNLVDTLSTRLHEENIALSIVVTFTDYYGQWIPTSSLEKADWVNVMAYDATGTWNASPFDNHSSYDHLLQGESYWNARGVTTDKIVMGVPFYGRKFENRDGGLAPGITYKEIVAKYPNLPDSVNLTDDLTFFNGPELIKKKCQYLIDHSFNGLLIWEMTQDASGHKSLFDHVICAYEGNDCPTTPPVCVVNDLNAGLVANYLFDGNTDEASGKTTGYLFNQAELTYDKENELNKAYFFDSDSVIVTDGHPDYDSQDHTISFWLNQKQDTSDVQVICAKWEDDDKGCWVVYTYDEYLSVQYQRGDDDFPFFNSAVKISNNEWYHVAIRHSFDNGISIFLNGLEIYHNATQLNYIERPEATMRFGGFNFRGKLDDFKLYNRELTDCEIWELFDRDYANEKLYCERVLEKSSCGNFIFDGKAYKESGEYQVFIDNGASCDSLITLNLDVYQKPFTFSAFTQEEQELVSYVSEYDIRWKECSSGNVISEETSFQVLDDGEYSIEYYNDYCSFESQCKPVLVSSVDQRIKEKFKVYPNPTSGIVNIQGENFERVDVYNGLGSLMKTSFSSRIDVSDLLSGIYLLQVRDQSGVVYTTRIKVK